MMRVDIYGRKKCVFCDAAKTLCEVEKLNYNYHQLDEDYTIEELFEKVQFKTFPQIFVNDVAVGGYTEFKKWFEKKEMR